MYSIFVKKSFRNLCSGPERLLFMEGGDCFIPDQPKPPHSLFNLMTLTGTVKTRTARDMALPRCWVSCVKAA